ncbi:hypothetical protein AB1E18_008105 [Capra hircus]
MTGVSADIESHSLASVGSLTMTSQKAFEDLVALRSPEAIPKGDPTSTSLNTPVPSGYTSEQDLWTNPKQ